MNSFFGSIFGTAQTRVDVTDFLLCIAVALILGLVLAASYIFRSKYTRSFAVTLALLPAIVCMVIMMVNGNIGAGVAVAGTFSLVRFRSAPGTAREILAIFLAMGTGLVIGMGYLGYAALFTVIMCAVLVLLNSVNAGAGDKAILRRVLKITIPEDLDYTDAFTDIFEEYTTDHELIRVKTTNMGSMFRLTYTITLTAREREKELIDAIRTRNANLEIMISKEETQPVEL